MSDIPQTDRDLMYRWEWFRRPQWQATFRAEVRSNQGALCHAFAELCSIIDGNVALHAECGLGQAAIYLTEIGVNLLAAESAADAVECTRRLAQQENSPLQVFQSSARELPEHAPHRFDAILYDRLCQIPDWEELRLALSGLFLTMKPGGFLMFCGCPPIVSPEEAALENEHLEWSFRDGGTTCTLISQTKKAENYIDTRYLYVINDKGDARLESTTVRLPCYWTWEHWQELTRQAGFCHLETRRYEQPDAEPLEVLVAWKSKDGLPHINTAEREAPYRQ